MHAMNSSLYIVMPLVIEAGSLPAFKNKLVVHLCMQIASILFYYIILSLFLSFIHVCNLIKGIILFSIRANLSNFLLGCPFIFDCC